jgi:hypothetical protein
VVDDHDVLLHLWIILEFEKKITVRKNVEINSCQIFLYAIMLLQSDSFLLTASAAKGAHNED